MFDCITNIPLNVLFTFVAAPQRYVPPALRGLPKDQQVPSGPKFREDYEKPSNLKAKDGKCAAALWSHICALQ